MGREKREMGNEKLEMRDEMWEIGNQEFWSWTWNGIELGPEKWEMGFKWEFSWLKCYPLMWLAPALSLHNASHPSLPPLLPRTEIGLFTRLFVSYFSPFEFGSSFIHKLNGTFLRQWCNGWTDDSRYNVHHSVASLSEVPRLPEFWQPLHFQLCASFSGKFVRVAKVARGLTTSPLSIMCIWNFWDLCQIWGRGSRNPRQLRMIMSTGCIN